MKASVKKVVRYNLPLCKVCSKQLSDKRSNTCNKHADKSYCIGVPSWASGKTWKLNLNEAQKLRRTEIGKARKDSPQTRERKSQSRLGMKLTPEHKANLKKAWETRPPTSDETRKKMSDSAIRGEAHSFWKGGIPESAKGRRNPGGKPRARTVAENFLGRPLLPRETIHHINENPSDDRIENFYLFRNNAAHMRWHWYIKRNKYPGTILESNLELYSIKT